MKLNSFQIRVLQKLNYSKTPLGDRFNVAWESIDSFDPLVSYQEVMDIQSPLMNEVRAHLVAQTLIGESS